MQESICFPYLDQGEHWIDEDSPLDHSGVFAGAADAEAAATRFTKLGGVGVVLRFAQLHGPGNSHVASFNALARRRINPFVGPPDAYTSLVHADDAAAAVATALGLDAGTYNVADDAPVTREEAGRILAAALRVKRLFAIPAAGRALMPTAAKALMRSQRVSNAKLRGASSWVPSRPSIGGSWSTATDAEVVS